MFLQEWIIMSVLDFEKPIFELETKIKELREFGSGEDLELGSAIKNLEKKLEQMRNKVYKNLTVWQRVQIARHSDRPYTLDYINMIMTDFIEIHGDRMFADDFALIAGFAKLDGVKVVDLGHQKGRETNEKLKRNFGCANPEGYRKAIRVMQMAEKFKLPIIVFIDTPGAYPGIGAEERGQAQAIACNLRDMARIKTPIIATVIGEGGSGGALGIGVADNVCILQHSYYSVISPEGCASILWRNSTKAPEAAVALKINGEDLIEFGIVDEIILEPQGGAHKDPNSMGMEIKKVLSRRLKELSAFSGEEIIEKRYERFRRIGEYTEKI